MKPYIFFTCTLAALVLFSCSPEGGGFKTTESGLQYRIIKGPGSGPPATTGATVKTHRYWYFRDTLRMTDRDTMPHYQALIPGLIFPYDISEALMQGVREGDSLVVRLRIDSLVAKKLMQKAPDRTQPHDAWVIGIKVLKVFPFHPLMSDSIIRSDQMQEIARLKAKDTIPARH